MYTICTANGYELQVKSNQLQTAVIDLAVQVHCVVIIEVKCTEFWVVLFHAANETLMCDNLSSCSKELFIGIDHSQKRMEMNICFKYYLNQNVNCRRSSWDGKLGNYQSRFECTVQAVNFMECFQTNLFPFLTVICPCIANIFPNHNQQDATLFELFISTNALHVLGGYSAHHQEHKTELQVLSTNTAASCYRGWDGTPFHLIHDSS